MVKDSVTCSLSIQQGSTFQQLEKGKQMVVNTQCWNWQKIKGNRDGKCAIKLSTDIMAGWLETDPGRAGILNREVWEARVVFREMGRCKVIRTKSISPKTELYL